MVILILIILINIILLIIALMIYSLSPIIVFVGCKLNKKPITQKTTKHAKPTKLHYHINTVWGRLVDRLRPLVSLCCYCCAYVCVCCVLWFVYYMLYGINVICFFCRPPPTSYVLYMYIDCILYYIWIYIERDRERYRCIHIICIHMYIYIYIRMIWCAYTR